METLIPADAVGAARPERCGPAAPGHARCNVRLAPSFGTQQVGADSLPAGFSPKQLKQVYGFPTGNRVGEGETVALVTAYDAPNLEADLKVFTKKFDLPSCTTGNGCFTKVDYDGGTNIPPASSAIWALEATLDVQWAHAIAPGAKILLVEAPSDNFVELFRAMRTAGARADYVSLSWGGPENPDLAIFEQLFTEFPNVSYFAAAGDSGLMPAYPAGSPNVVAVGGTRLKVVDGEFKKETGWSSGGGGCSAVFNATASQLNHPTYPQVGCAGRRAFPDVSSLGDPDTPAAIYISSAPFSGWEVIAGTSLSSPIIAARAAGTRQLVRQPYIYGDQIAFRDIRDGNNGAPCLRGFDLVTGRGSWTG